jgi:ATP-binding cassette subfamily B multidrug efflux pump
LKKLYRFIAHYGRPYWQWYLGGIAFLIATNWLTVRIPLELARAIDALGPQGDPEVIDRAVVLIAGMGVGIMVVRTLSRVLFFTPGRLIEFRVKNDILAHMMRLQPQQLDQWENGDIVSRTSNDITFLRALVGFGGLQIVNVTVAITLAGYQMMALSPRLTMLCLAPMAVGIVIVQFGISEFPRLVRKSQVQLSSLSSHILSTLHGIQTVQSFNAEDALEKEFVTHNQTYLETNLELAHIRSFYMPLLVHAGGLSIAILLVVGGNMVQTGALSVGELVGFTAYVAILLNPLRSLGWLLSVFQRGMTSLERTYELLDTVPDRPEGLNGVHPQSTQGPAFSIRELNYAYPDAPEKPVLQDISIDLPSGHTIGIFGKTGSGKTTLLRLLTRSINPPEGSLFVDNVDIRKLDLNAWRSQVSVVPQRAFLFSQSLAENVAMGPMDRERVLAAVNLAALGPDLEVLPNGVDTLVGQRGIMLSGGQRQRTALARGIYRKSRCLVLDDVLSAVDHGTEKRLIAALEQRSIEGLSGERPTTLLVSNRLSALTHATLILVLDEGRLIDHGNHTELIARPGPYQDAWRHQSGAE